MTITGTPVDNGVNTAALLGAREALTAAPEAAEFTWRATTSWVNGTHSNSTGETFSGLGQDHTHVSTFTFDADHPECFASEDHGATPAEYVLVALGSCLTGGLAAVAQHREIQLRKVTATVEGDMNVLGILGADPDIRNGYRGIRVRFDIDSPAPAEDVRAVVAQSQARSAVFDVLTNGTAVEVSVG